MINTLRNKPLLFSVTITSLKKYDVMEKIVATVLIVCISCTLSIADNKSNTKKLNTKKIFREEHKIVQSWGTIYDKLYGNKKRMKKKFK